jgi:hypothetical protein
MALLARWRNKAEPIRRKPSRLRKSVRLEIERLETRYCPSPVITNFHAPTTIANHQVELMGTVQDTDPGSIIVTFSGPGLSASITLSGSASFDVLTTATSLGTVNALATNQRTGQTGSASAPITDRAPSITNFTASQLGGGYWVFQGQVTDDQSVAGLVVTLAGLPSLQGVTATVNSNGWFSVTVRLKTGESGTATAQTTDCWGLASNTAWTIVQP